MYKGWILISVSSHQYFDRALHPQTDSTITHLLIMKFTSLFTLAALATGALAKHFTLYFSTHDTEYYGSFHSAIDRDAVKLADGSGKQLTVLGGYTFNGPSETMIALSLDRSHVVWVSGSYRRYILKLADRNVVHGQAQQGAQRYVGKPHPSRWRCSRQGQERAQEGCCYW